MKKEYFSPMATQYILNAKDIITVSLGKYNEADIKYIDINSICSGTKVDG